MNVRVLPLSPCDRRGGDGMPCLLGSNRAFESSHTEENTKPSASITPKSQYIVLSLLPPSLILWDMSQLSSVPTKCHHWRSGQGAFCPRRGGSSFVISARSKVSPLSAFAEYATHRRRRYGLARSFLVLGLRLTRKTLCSVLAPFGWLVASQKVPAHRIFACPTVPPFYIHPCPLG